MFCSIHVVVLIVVLCLVVYCIVYCIVSIGSLKIIYHRSVCLVLFCSSVPSRSRPSVDRVGMVVWERSWRHQHDVYYNEFPTRSEGKDEEMKTEFQLNWVSDWMTEMWVRIRVAMFVSISGYSHSFRIRLLLFRFYPWNLYCMTMEELQVFLQNFESASKIWYYLWI